MSSKKEKYHSRWARVNILKANERSTRRRTRRYDRQEYDKPASEVS
jgi:hypothetical protein